MGRARPRGNLGHHPERGATGVDKAEQDKRSITAIGITNQRETTVMGPRQRQTGLQCHRLAGLAHRRILRIADPKATASITQKTGLLLDPYFSGTKVNWILQNVDVREKAERGERLRHHRQLFDLRLTGGSVHATDATNASRTALFNIHQQDWDRDLLELLSMVGRDSALRLRLRRRLRRHQRRPVATANPDYRRCRRSTRRTDRPGLLPSRYDQKHLWHWLLRDAEYRGEALTSNKLLSTMAYRLNGKPCYALEGSIFVAGAAVQWLRDYRYHRSAAETEAMAASVESNQGVYLVPAFTGLEHPPLGPGSARHDFRHYPGYRPGSGAGDPGIGLLPDPGLVRRQAPRWYCANAIESRRRYGS